MWSLKRRVMRLSSEMREIHRCYRYRPRGRCWAVYLDITYRQGDSFPPEISTLGTKVNEYPTREEARREVYRLNGWNYERRKRT